MKNKEIFEKLLNLKQEDCIHKLFSFRAFNIGDLAEIKNVPNCGTIGCLAGELPQFTEEFFFDKGGNLSHRSSLCVDFGLSVFFGLKQDYIDAMFYPDQQIYIGLQNISEDASFKKVIANARKVKQLLIKEGLY